MKKQFRLSKRAVLAVIVFFLLLVLAFVVLGIIGIFEGQQEELSSTPSTQSGAVQIYGPDGKLYQEKNNMETVLFMGVDKYEEDAESGSYISNQQADVLILTIIDHDAKTYSLLPINRDTVTQIETYGVGGQFSGTIDAQIALSYAYGDGEKGSCENTVRAVENLLYDIDIDHYLSLKMDAIAVLNDAVGGVEVELLDDFTSIDESYVKGATVTLQGDQALTYIRARSGLDDSTNVHRMERQQQYMLAWTEAYHEAAQKDDSFVASTLLSVEEYLVSNLTLHQADALSDSMESYSLGGVLSVIGESVKGEQYMEFYVDEEALTRLIFELFYTPVS